MAKFIDNNKNVIDSEFSIETISDIQGLVIESWGNTKNPEYATAFEMLLSRLQSFGIPEIQVFVVSKPLTKLFPNISDREIFIDNQNISLINKRIEEVRISVGREVSNLKESPGLSKGGNRHKRVLIHSPLINTSQWEILATSVELNNKNIFDNLTPTSDSVILEKQVNVLEKYIKIVPKGQLNPKENSKQTSFIERDPLVKAWILREAKGICENCNVKSQIIKDNGTPYLEVHHVHHLANNGADTIYNTVALCPNCHRALHYSNGRNELKEKIYKKIDRLVHKHN